MTSGDDDRDGPVVSWKSRGYAPVASATSNTPKSGTSSSDERYRRALAALVASRVEEKRRSGGTGGPDGPAASASRTAGSGTRPARTVFVLRETSVATKALRVSLIWVVIVVFMATADALSPQTFIQVSAWLSLFFLGVLLSFWAVFSLSRAAAATGALIGTFLGPYSLTWQLWVTYVKHWGGFFPVRLYPFTIVLDQFQWYAMMAFGFGLFGLSIAALARLSRPRLTYIRVQHDSGEAYRLGDHP